MRRRRRRRSRGLGGSHRGRRTEVTVVVGYAAVTSTKAGPERRRTDFRTYVDGAALQLKVFDEKYRDGSGRERFPFSAGKIVFTHAVPECFDAIKKKFRSRCAV